jgi:hypothetical protein
MAHMQISKGISFLSSEAEVEIRRARRAEVLAKQHRKAAGGS